MTGLKGAIGQCMARSIEVMLVLTVCFPVGTTEVTRRESVMGGLAGLVQNVFGSLNRTVRMRV